MKRWAVFVLVLAGLCGCVHSRADGGVAKIAAFQGEYRFLSNFWPAVVVDEGITYPTVEHAYQAAKTLDIGERRRIAGLATPAEAKRAGEALVLRPDWAEIKYAVMLRCVRYKFEHHAELGEKLMATGDAYLEEGNTWHDEIWGVYAGRGTNWLGKILMQVRGELRGRGGVMKHRMGVVRGIRRELAL